MHWVIQNNMYNEEGFNVLINAMLRLSLTFSVHKVIPFSREITPEIDPDGDVMVMGTYSMARIAKERGWSPGAFTDNLDFEAQLPKWGPELLNSHATVSRFEDVLPWHYPKFIRPTLDSKSFSGSVMDWGELEEWRHTVLSLDPKDHPLVNADTKIMVCPQKEIYSETRVWIVDNVPVTASEYKRGTIVRYSDNVDPYILAYAERMASIWSPNEAYCMDIADTPEGLKIVEAGLINACGFYKGDMWKVAEALEKKFT